MNSGDGKTRDLVTQMTGASWDFPCHVILNTLSNGRSGRNIAFKKGQQINRDGFQLRLAQIASE